jgi:hypothetical protein
METNVSEYKQRGIIHDCFNGNTDRNCSKCPAHHSKGGICCFSDIEQFDEGDEDCQRCDFQDDCRQEVINEEAESQHAQQTWGVGWRPPQKTVQSRFAPSSSQPSRPRLVQIGGIRTPTTSTTTTSTRTEELKRPTVITPPSMTQQPISKEVDSMFVLFLKQCVWGAGQGFCEMAAHFFRTHKWS